MVSRNKLRFLSHALSSRAAKFAENCRFFKNKPREFLKPLQVEIVGAIFHPIGIAT